MGWSILPIIPLALAAATLFGSLALFLSAKRETQELRRLIRAEREEGQAGMEALRHSIEQLERELDEERKAAQERPRIGQSSMNLSKRSQALRMHRLGAPPEKIAQALDLSRTEVDLLLKVHRTVIESVTSAASRHTAAATGAGQAPERAEAPMR